MSRQQDRAAMRIEAAQAVNYVAGPLPRRVRRQTARTLAKARYQINHVQKQQAEEASKTQG